MTQSHETQTPEQQPYTTEEIAGALQFAHSVLPRMQQDESFHAACAESGIPLSAQSDPAYWHQFQSYVNTRTQGGRENGQDQLRMDALDLLAGAPAFMLADQKLSTRQITDYGERRQARELVSTYNGLIRNFAYSYPETSVKSLEASLLYVAAQAIHGKGPRQAAGHKVHATLRGAQHEVAFGQVLMTAGIPCRETNVDEDLKGLDYVIGEGSQELGVDVKASLSEIENKGSDQLFAVSKDGAIVIYSMLRDTELGDRFFLSTELAQHKAPQVFAQLELAYAAARKAL